MKKQMVCVEVLVPTNIIIKNTSSEVAVTEGANKGIALFYDFLQCGCLYKVIFQSSGAKLRVIPSPESFG